MLQSSWVWSELRGLARRCLFSKRAVRQYTGFVQDRLRKAAKALVRHVFLHPLGAGMPWRGCCVTLRFVSLNLDAFLLAGGRG